MKVLDLFSGLGGWSRAFRDRGHEVITLDIDPRFEADWQVDILGVESLTELGAGWDVVLASPPCETFSVASIGTHWTGGRRAYEPRTEAAKQGLAIMEKTFTLIGDYCEAYLASYAIENPRGLMRKLAPNSPDATVWYCKLGDSRAKPTDIWHNIPVRLPAMCRNENPDCTHQRAKRGAKTGTQGLHGAARALVPYGLSLTMCLGVEYARAA